MLKAIVTIGISASGKTTWAENFVNEPDNNGEWVNINRDDIRFDTFCDGERNWTKYKFKRSNEARVSDICDTMIKQAAAEGLNIVCSDTNLNSKYRNRLVDKLEGLGYSVEIREFPITLEDAWKRDSLRSNGVGHTIIARQWEQWQSYLKEKGDVKVYQPDRSKERAVIVDIDGTLAHMTSRGPFEWEKVGEDNVDALVASVVEGLHLQGYRIILLSGRDSVCREQTEYWLEKHNISHDRLHMRPEGDFRKDTVVKEEVFWQYVADNYNVKGVIDDRPVVCRMWRDLGLKVLNVGNPWVEF